MTAYNQVINQGGRIRPLPWHSGHIQILRTLHLAGPGGASRRELANESGLSPQSLSRIASELIDSGFVRELQRRRNGGMGQPAIELGIVPGSILSLGLVIEHDRITCLTSDLAMGIVRRAERTGNFLGAEMCAEIGEELIAEALDLIAPDATMLGLGVSQSGFFFDPALQRIVNRGDVQGWSDLDLGSRLSVRFDIDVIIENDGRAAAAGHLIHGVGTQFNSFFLVLMTRGLGGGAVMDRRLLRGRAGNAGEIAMLEPAHDGRSPMQRPTIESLAELLGVALNDAVLEIAVDAAFARNDPALLDWLDAMAQVLNGALASVCALLDPEAIILAGRMPTKVRAALAAGISVSGPSIGNIAAPAPEIVVDPAADCLEVGAAALPVARIFSSLNNRAS